MSMETDVLVVGAGIAGLCVALMAAPRRVALLYPEVGAASSSSAMAQGGLAAALSPPDSLASHAADTLEAACYSADPAAVRELLAAAPAAVQFLEASGVQFDRGPAGRSLHREAGHACARVLHAAGDRSGQAMVAALWERVRAARHIDLLPGWRALQLVHRRGEGLSGIHAAHESGRRALISARETVLATGGLGQMFACTTNGPYATGDGLAMALAVGARTAALEFVQFHPTALRVTADPLPLLTEALRGAGARLVTGGGRLVMAGRHRMGDLAPRDVVARAVWDWAQRGEDVLLDARPLFADTDGVGFPGTRDTALHYGIDPARDLLPITAAAHYHMGGIVVDRSGRSSVPHLWACGEVAHTGLHGANRLASNSLLEAVVCGRELGAALRSGPAGASHTTPVVTAFPDIDPGCGEDWQALRALMWKAMGPARDGATLRVALAALLECSRTASPDRLVLRQRLQLATAMVRAAAERRESRGAHWRVDYPERNPRLDGPGAMHAAKLRPINLASQAREDTASPQPCDEARA